MTVAEQVADLVAEGDGVLRLDPAFVARTFLPAGRRLGLPDADYDVGERGWISERWLASTTPADNPTGPPDEGLSAIRGRDGRRLRLATAVAEAPDVVLGARYAATHDGLGRLAKIFDYAARLPFHLHPPSEQAALVGRRSKDEAYYFPSGVDRGAHPETFLGLHPGLHPAVAGDRGARLLVDDLRAWDSDDVLTLSRAYVQVPEEGFFVPSGLLHAPGTALTVELQEDSDTLAMFQALNDGRVISKELLFKDVPSTARQERGEAALLDWVDWDANTDPFLHEHRRLVPVPYRQGPGVDEAWILYGSGSFVGRRLVLAPGARWVGQERGVFSLLVWRGRGTVAGHDVAGGLPGQDELVLVHERAVQPHEYVNTGDEDLVVLLFFGPDLNPEAPTAGAADVPVRTTEVPPPPVRPIDEPRPPVRQPGRPR